MILITLLLFSTVPFADMSSPVGNYLKFTIDWPLKKIFKKTRTPQACGEIVGSNPPNCENFDEELLGFDAQHPPFRRLSAAKNP